MATFPLNKPVLVTGVLDSSGKAGESGTLARSLDAIADQEKTVTIVVCVTQGETEAESTSNIIGGVTGDEPCAGQRAIARNAAAALRALRGYGICGDT